MLPLAPVIPSVSPVTHAGVISREVPTRNGCEALMPLAVKVYETPGVKAIGRTGLNV